MSVATLLTLLGAYVLGSIPFAVVVSRAFGLADPRSYGSGNPGATNVLRSGNKLAAMLTLIGDASKGAIAVLVCRALSAQFDLAPELVAWAGAAAFAGHVFPVFLRFHGGKGVATFLGTLLALMPLVGVATCMLWLGIAAWTRYSSAASMVCAASATLALLGVPAPPGSALAVGLMSIFLIARHWRNIGQLLSGKESKIGESSAPPPPAA